MFVFKIRKINFFREYSVPVEHEMMLQIGFFDEALSAQGTSELLLAQLVYPLQLVPSGPALRRRCGQVDVVIRCR